VLALPIEISLVSPALEISAAKSVMPRISDALIGNSLCTSRRVSQQEAVVMKKLLFVPAIMFAACVDKPAIDEPVSTETGQGIGSDYEQFDTPVLVAGFLQDPGSCDDSSASLLAHYWYSDGSPTDNVVCQYIFADGSTSDGCFASRSFPEAEKVILVVRDTVTLAETRAEDIVEGPEHFSATLDVTSSGLSIAWDAHTLYGTYADINDVFISIEPADKVVETDPAFFAQLSATAHVTEPGTYTVKLFSSITFGEEGGCAAFVDKTVEVVADGGGGGGEPPCDTQHAP
jgi:hypothetical protein